MGDIDFPILDLKINPFFDESIKIGERYKMLFDYRFTPLKSIFFLNEKRFYCVLTHHFPCLEFYDNKFLCPFCAIEDGVDRKYDFATINLLDDEEEKNKAHKLLFNFYQQAVIRKVRRLRIAEKRIFSCCLKQKTN
jgi:hypothetical protein